MTHPLLGFLCVGLLTCGLALNTAQAQNDLAPTGDGPTVELSDPIPLPAFRGNLLFDNGPLVNSAGTGINGEDESVLQNTSLLMNTLGAGHQVLNQNFVADDFTVPPEGWDINTVETFAYQTNGGPGGSTMTQVHMCIWDGPPSTSPNLVWGDCATNVMGTTQFSNILRVTETSTGTTDNRSIYRQASDVIVSLTAGTYWLMWATDGSLGSGPWAPPVTITGQTTTGNAEQCIAGTTGGVCNPLTDSGTLTGQGVPFQIYGTVVPVEFISFDAIVSGTDVSLNWATASETNNAGFEVQTQNGEGWDVLGFVGGHGTTTEAQTYSFTAEGLGVGTHAFRLKQIDYDGQFEYFGDVEALVETPGTHLISSAYPNPFNPQSQFALSVAQEQHVTAELFNTVGQRVAVLFQGSVEANQPQLVTIDGADLASGMYVIRVRGDQFSDAFSVTLLK